MTTLNCFLRRRKSASLEEFAEDDLEVRARGPQQRLGGSGIRRPRQGWRPWPAQGSSRQDTCGRRDCFPEARRLANRIHAPASGLGRPFELLRLAPRDSLFSHQHMADPAPASVAALAVPNSAGHTRMHLAARYGELASLPPEALTATYLTLKNDAGYTPLHHAAIGGHLDQVPPAVMTLENLSIAQQRRLHRLPFRRRVRQPGADPGEPLHAGGVPERERRRQHPPARGGGERDD
jgi:hypothetical protein